MSKYNLEDRHIITMEEQQEIALYTEDLHVWYGQNEAIKGVDLQFEKNKITALIAFFRLWEINVSTIFKSNE